MIRSVGLRSAVLSVLLLASAAGPSFAQSASPPVTPSFGHAAVVQRDGEPSLLVDGKPFFFWGGAFFYERLPPSRWRTTMEQMRRLGANALDLYVPWNWHEIADGDFDFDGRTNPRRNLREVIRLGRELGFHFIVRPGPVIRNEWRNGGYPAWLLTRPEYGMPLHDVLEGRYPATATLQNAHSDDAAAEWLANGTHLRYASRWLHAALREFAPVADRVIAVQLDDDQGAYIDNQTYPAPNLTRYLGWLDAQVRDVIGPVTPTFINTYDMRVPASSPVWTMGNWYQSDAYAIGEHDRAELDFTTAILRTNRRGPLAQSEFQAGWLAAPEDPAPRPADPKNTTLALYELLAWGAHGIIDFPMHDTLAPFGWEAPFSNAFYGWDAALRYDLDPPRVWGGEVGPDFGQASPRYRGTADFGRDIERYGALLAEAHRWSQTALAYPGSAYPGEPSRGAVAIARFRATLASCVARGGACDVVDLRTVTATQLLRYHELVVEDAASAANAGALLRSYRAGGGSVVSTPSVANVPGTLLVGSDASFLIATNWSATPTRTPSRTVVADGRQIAIPAFELASRSAVMIPIDVRLRRLDPRFDADARATLPCWYRLDGEGLSYFTDCPPLGRIAHRPIAPATAAAQRRVVTLDAAGKAIRTEEWDPLAHDVIGTMGGATHVHIAPAANVTLAGARASVPAGTAVAYRADVFEDGASDVVLQNDRVQAVIVPGAGARLPIFHGVTPVPPLTRQQLGPGDNVFDATGGLRDDVLVQPPPSTTDRIGKWTRSYPAGMFNRAYATATADVHGTAVARSSYYAPDVVPNGACFQRIASLAPDSGRLVIDERLVVSPGDGADRQRLVVLSSLAKPPAPFAATVGGPPLPLDTASDLRAPGIASLAGGTVLGTFVTAVSWSPAGVESARWEPHRSNATLRLVLAPGWQRVTYATAYVKDPDAARRFVEAERAWVAANPAPGDGEVAKWYTQSPQKRPSESSCGFESHLPQ